MRHRGTEPGHPDRRIVLAVADNDFDVAAKLLVAQILASAVVNDNRLVRAHEHSSAPRHQSFAYAMRTLVAGTVATINQEDATYPRPNGNVYH